MNGESTVILPIHFNVNKHEIAFRNFVETTRATEKIFNELNQKLFDGKLKYELVIIPPEPGTFLNKIGWKHLLIGTAVASWGFIESDIGKAYIKGLTGQEPAYWSERAGEATKELVLLRDATKGALEKTSEELCKSGITNSVLPKLFEGKREFYNSCLANEEISGIGFSPQSNFPISRNSFSNHISKLNEELDQTVDLKVHELVIISPVTADKNNIWRTIDKNTKEKINFYLKDDDFHWKFLAGKFPLKQSQEDDELIALIRHEKTYKNGEIVFQRKSAVKIYQFNQLKLADIPSDISVSSINNSEGLQMNLF